MKTFIITRRMQTAGGELTWIIGAADTEGEARAQQQLLDNDLKAIMSCKIVGSDGQPAGTVGQFFQGLGVTGLGHGRLLVEPKSRIHIPEKIIIQ